MCSPICQGNRTRVAVRTVRRDTAEPGMESLTNCQTRVAVRTVRRDTAGRMESLTYYQANRIRVAVRTVRRDTAGPGMESPTPCQANSIKIGLIRRELLHLARSPTSNGIQPKISNSKFILSKI